MQDEILARFAAIVEKYGIKTSHEYDQLSIEKPSRSLLRSHFGSWQGSLDAAKRFLKEGKKAPQSTIHPEVFKLRQQVEDLTRHIQTPALELQGAVQTFGVIGDTHIGSLYADMRLLQFAYNVFEEEGVVHVLHAGDLLDGEKMYRGQEYELQVHGADAQIDFCVQNYPSKPGITTYFIDGNHDRSFWKRSGICSGRRISQSRPDLIYLGYQEADITVGENECKATIRLFHSEDGSSSYALSYRPQRYISELPSGTKPDLLLIGHYHKAELLFYRGVSALQVGTLQKQTPFMRGRRISAALGFWIVNIVIAPKRVVRVRAEFFPVRT